MKKNRCCQTTTLESNSQLAQNSLLNYSLYQLFTFLHLLLISKYFKISRNSEIFGNYKLLTRLSFMTDMAALGRVFYKTFYFSIDSFYLFRVCLPVWCQQWREVGGDARDISANIIHVMILFFKKGNLCSIHKIWSDSALF